MGKGARLKRERGPRQRAPRGIPAINIDPNYFEGGRPRYNLHGAWPWMCIEDLACEEAKATWPNYVEYFDNQGIYRQGPALFRSMTEKRAYYKQYGFRPNDRGEIDETSFQAVRRRQKELRRGRVTQILEIMNAYGFNDQLSRMNRDRGR